MSLQKGLQDRFLTRKELREVVPLSLTTLWRLEKRGEFPPRRKISKIRVGWLHSEVMSWLNSRDLVGSVHGK